MFKTTFLLLTVFLFLQIPFLICQEVNETPINFGQFYNNPLINLSKNGLDSKLDLKMNDQRNLGGFGGVSTFYFSAFFNPQKEKRSKNIYGIYFYNNQEGDYISRNRVQISFSRHQKIATNWNLSLSVSSGFYLFSLKPSTITLGFRSLAFEGNSSMLIYSKKLQFGLSMNQFTNSKIQPVTQITRLRRHYYLYGQYLYENKNFKWIPNIYLKYERVHNDLSLRREFQGGISSRLLYRIIMAGISAEIDGMNFIVGLNDWEMFGKKIGFDISYFTPIFNQANINVNKMEFNFQIKF